MGDKLKFYYLKPKSGSKISSGRSRTKSKGAIRTRSSRSIILEGSGPVMDMSFGSTKAVAMEPLAGAASASTSIWFWLKLALIVFLAIILYVGGGLIYQGAENIKGNITDMAVRGIGKLEAAAAAIVEQDIQLAVINFTAAENLFLRANRDILSLGQTNLYLSNLAGSDSQIVTGQKLIDSGINLAQAGQLLVKAMTPVMQYFDGINNHQVRLPDVIVQVASLLNGSARDLDRALGKVNKANQLLTSVTPRLVDPAYGAVISSARNKTAALQSLIVTISTVTQELPGALGMKNPRYYLILNQNDTELRPTGGFMGSYTLVEIYHGEIVDIFVDDTYRIDGQLVGPLSSEKVIPNANFDPDFITSANYIEKLYEQSGGGSVDGVIAINTQVVSQLLTVLGNIYLPQRDITVTPANFSEIVHREIDSEGDTQFPKQVLAELLPVVLEQFQSLTRAQLNELGSILLTQLQQNNLLLKSNNHKLQDVIETLSWSGDLHYTGAKQDFLMVVRANMGARKSSYSIVEEIDHTANVNLLGRVQNILQLTYTHVGSDEYPDGINQEFVRVYVPEGSTLQTLSGSDEDTQITTEIAHNKTFFGFWITTRPGETREVTLHYDLPFTLSADTDAYSIYFQKQPGANSTLLNSTLKLSPALQIAEDAAQKSKRLFQDKLVKDLSLSIDFTKVN